MADHEPPPRSTAEIDAHSERLKLERRRADKLEKEKKLEERRARMGERTSTSGVQLAPMSPSPSKKRASREGKKLSLLLELAVD